MLLIRALGRLRLGGSGLYPVLALASAGLLYGVTSLAGGSGFSAVFVAGLLLGDARLPYASEIDRFSASLASFAEVAVFLALGLTIELGGIPGQDWLGGLAILAIMAVLVRPLVVGLTLARSALSRREKGFIAWSGLKGAVPILLAAFAVLGDVPDSQRIYDLVFVVVLGSVVIQGGLVPTVAARLRIPMQLQPDLPWELSVKLAHPPRGSGRDRRHTRLFGRRHAPGRATARRRRLGDPRSVTIAHCRPGPTSRSAATTPSSCSASSTKRRSRTCSARATATRADLSANRVPPARPPTSSGSTGARGRFRSQRHRTRPRMPRLRLASLIGATVLITLEPGHPNRVRQYVMALKGATPT